MLFLIEKQILLINKKVHHLNYLCLVFVMLSRLFIAALWSPAGERADLSALVCDV